MQSTLDHPEPGTIVGTWWCSLGVWLVLVAGLLALTVAGPASSAGTNEPTRPAAAPSARSLPFDFTTELTVERATNLTGGLATGTAYDALLRVGLETTSDTIGLPAGGRLHVLAAAISSGDPSIRYVGDFQEFSNIDAPSHLRLYDAWFHQQFHRLPLQLRAGIIDLNDLFDDTVSAGTLINSSFGIGSSLSGNAPFSIYPKPGYAVVGIWGAPASRFLFGAFQGMPDARFSVLHRGLMTIGEWQHQLGHGKTLKLGAWKCDCKQDGGSAGAFKTYGAYLSAESTIRRGAGIPAVFFLRAGLSQGEGRDVPRSFAVGINVPSPVGGRPEDVFSGGMTHAELAGRPAETSYEITYSLQAEPWFQVQPDIQYIHRPDGNLPDAWVVVLRLHLEYETHF